MTALDHVAKALRSFRTADNDSPPLVPLGNALVEQRYADGEPLCIQPNCTAVVRDEAMRCRACHEEAGE